MPPANFLVFGPGIRRVGRVAEQLHQSFAGLLETPQLPFPDLAGKRLFYIQYDDLDAQDVEVIRLELEKALKTQAWSQKLDANGKSIFYPERGLADVIPSRPAHTEEEEPPLPYDDFPGQPYEADYDDGAFDWEWDYPAPRPHHGRGRDSHSNAYASGYEDPLGSHSHRSHHRSSFATGHGHHDRYEDQFEPLPFRDSRRSTFPSNHNHCPMYPDEYGPPGHHHSRRTNTFPSNYGNNYGEYRDHTSRGHPPYASNSSHYHTPTHPPHQRRSSSYANNYDRPGLHTDATREFYHFPSSSGGHGRNRHADAAMQPRAAPLTRSNQPRGGGRKRRFSRKFWNIVQAFLMYAVT